MMSVLEFRQIVESAFLPLKCICTVAPDDSITIQIREPSSDDVMMTLAGLKRSELSSSRGISKLVLGIRQDLAALRSDVPRRHDSKVGSGKT